MEVYVYINISTSFKLSNSEYSVDTAGSFLLYGFAVQCHVYYRQFPGERSSMVCVLQLDLKC